MVKKKCPDSDLGSGSNWGTSLPPDGAEVVLADDALPGSGDAVTGPSSGAAHPKG